MKKLITFVLTIVMVVTALVGTSVTAFAAVEFDLDGGYALYEQLCEERHAITPEERNDIFSSFVFVDGYMNGPDSTGWLLDLALRHTDFDWDNPTSTWWVMEDGVLLIFNGGSFTLRIKGMTPDPFVNNPYIETVICVGGHLSYNFENCPNLKTVIVTSGRDASHPNELQPAWNSNSGKEYWTGSVSAAEYFDVFTHLPATVENVIGGIDLNSGNPMTVFDTAYNPVAKGVRDVGTRTNAKGDMEWGTVVTENSSMNGWGNPTTQYTFFNEPYTYDGTTANAGVEYGKPAGYPGATVYSDRQAFVNYVNGVLAETKLTQNARNLLASYGYDCGGDPGAYVQPRLSSINGVLGANGVGSYFPGTAPAYANKVPADMTSTSTLLIGPGGGTVPIGASDDQPLKVSPWAMTDVAKAFGLGIGNSMFAAADCTVPITRKQFAQLAMDTVMRTAPIDATARIGYDYFEPTPFPDVDDGAVTAAYELGIVNGYGNGKFGPDDLITREQAAVLLSNLAAACGKPMTASATPFRDKISDWATDGVAKCFGAGIMSGVGNNLFDAGGSYTIEQSLATMVRIADYINK